MQGSEPNPGARGGAVAIHPAPVFQGVRPCVLRFAGVTPSRVHGRYALYETLGVGAAAEVHLGVSRGPEVVPVAIKRLHDRKSRETAAVAGLLDEVRLSRHVVHPNVVRIVDFVSDGEEMLAVMEYVHGEPLSRLLADVKESGGRTSVGIATAIVCDVLRGLYAAHVATDADGRPLALVHRDVTPENILVGADGVARLMDFGVAKAQGRLHATKDGGVRGKLAYLAPEQVGGDVTPRTDLYAVGLVLWEMLTGERVITGETEPELLVKAMDPSIEPPSTRAAQVSPRLDAVVMRALCKEPEGRFADANAQADAIEDAARPLASTAEVSAWVRVHGGARLAARDANVRAMLAAETASSHALPRGGVATAAAAAASAPDRARGFAVMAFAMLAVLAVGLWWRAAPEPAVAPALEATVAPPVLASAVAPVPVAVAQPAVVAATVTATATATTAAVTPDVPEPRRPAPAASARRPAARANAPSCDPPWVLDANGIKRYDPACVK